MKTRKKGSGHFRAKLLTMFLDLSLSPDTQRKISKIIANYPNEEKENAAMQILEKIRECKNEAEVTAKLNIQ